MKVNLDVLFVKYELSSTFSLSFNILIGIKADQF